MNSEMVIPLSQLPFLALLIYVVYNKLSAVESKLNDVHEKMDLLVQSVQKLHR